MENKIEKFTFTTLQVNIGTSYILNIYTKLNDFIGKIWQRPICVTPECRNEL